MSQHFLKLRANITLPGDVALAERELRNRYERLYPLEDEQAFSAATGLDVARLSSHARPHAFAGFVGVGPKQSLRQLTRELSCIQEIWVPKTEVTLEDGPTWTLLQETPRFAKQMSRPPVPFPESAPGRFRQVGGRVHAKYFPSRPDPRLRCPATAR